ncbi:MAG: hypothetical protein DRO01_00145 [Thermoproteota archaeon]|nr:MAG: hypothetical protein DRO01_00145 [Candidatus Korarchaeota archaeon]
MSYFGMFAVMLISILYAPLWFTSLIGVLGSFVASQFVSNYLKKRSRKESIFSIARKLGKVVVMTFMPPNRAYFFLADKEVSSNSIKLKILKNQKWETYKFPLSPEQEFFAEVPPQEIEIKKEFHITEFLENPFIIWELTDPQKQVFRVEPEGAEMVIFVYPSEIITQDQLRAWNLHKIGETKKTIKVKDEEGKTVEKSITIPVYSPNPYALGMDNIKQLSAYHRFGQITTILEQTREILSHAERVIGVKAPSGIGGFFDKIVKDKRILGFIILLVAGIVLFALAGQFFGAMNAQISKKMTEEMLKKGVKVFP